MWAALEARLAARGGTTAPTRSRTGAGARTVARRAASPVRNYVNAHFEATKQELREQVATLTRRHEQLAADLAGVAELTTTVEGLAGTVADMHVHQTRTTLALADQVADLRRDVAELGADVRTLADVLVRLAEAGEGSHPAGQ